MGNRGRGMTGAILALAALLICGSCSETPREPGSSTEAGADWSVYHGNAGATHYSRLAQIDRQNVAQLKVAWTYDTHDAFGDGASQSDMQVNPLIVRERLVLVSPRGRIICLDAATGQERWSYDPAEGTSVSTRQRSRGVAYWTDGKAERILFTFRQSLIALDMADGKPVAGFGRGGRIDLREGMGRPAGSISVTNVTPGVVYRDLLILGSTGNTPGHVRAYDVRTGAMRWIFHTIPHPGEQGYETWPKDAWKSAQGANAWAGLTLDPEAGTVFLPLASGGMLDKDFYGADRHGDNLFANAIVALDAATGKRRWHFQTVRHDLWDRDLPAQPTLVTVERGGRRIPAVAQVTKSGLVYVLDRATGESLFPLETRQVPASDIPGEQAATTQMLPRVPAPFARQRLTADLLTRRTPEAQAAVAAEFRKYRSGGAFDPPSTQGTIIFPGLDGGAEWGGAAFDPTTGLLYVNANEMAWILKLRERPRAAEGSGGRAVYLNNCASCHGEDRKGSPPEFPSLVDVARRIPRIEMLVKIRTGGGRMPAFGQLPSDQADAVIEYLVSGKDIGGGAGAGPRPTQDPGSRYVFDGYTKFLDPDGYPAVAPPWGTLSAIDLNGGTLK